jgi:hypothetical protein
MKPLPDNLSGCSAGSMTGGEAIAILEPRYRLLLPEVAQTKRITWANLSPYLQTELVN